MLVVCLELAISNRIVVFQLFPRTKLGKTVLQVTLLYITGPHSRRFGLKTPPQIINAFEIYQPLLSQISHVPQRLLRIQRLYRCFMPVLSLLCPGTSLVHYPSCTQAISKGC